MTPLPDPIAVAARVSAVLDTIGAQYSIGGSLASSFSGEARATMDIDMVVSMDETQIASLVEALQDDFYIDSNALLRAVRQRSTTNLIEPRTNLKVDLFIAGGTVLDVELLRRRVLVSPGENRPERLWIHSPEDILLQKLRWFRRGGEQSDRQWRDVISIIRVQGKRLDRSYLESGAEQLGVGDLLTRALASA